MTPDHKKVCWEAARDLIIFGVITFVFLWPVPNYLALAIIGGALIINALRKYQKMLKDNNKLQITLRRYKT